MICIAASTSLAFRSFIFVSAISRSWASVTEPATAGGQQGRVTPVEISVYEDRSFTFITKTPPAAVLIKEALGIEGGSADPKRDKVGKLSQAQLRDIAEQKLQDLNANDVEAAMKIVAGTARSMGVEVEA